MHNQLEKALFENSNDIKVASLGFAQIFGTCKYLFAIMNGISVQTFSFLCPSMKILLNY